MSRNNAMRIFRKIYIYGGIMKNNRLSKILVSFMLAVSMIFSFVACGSQQSTEASVESIDVRSTLRLTIGAESQLQVALNPFGVTAAISYRSSNTAVATVSDDGLVKGISVGNAKIRISAGGKTAECLVTVEKTVINVTKITLNKGVLNLQVGDSSSLTATVLPDNATDKTVEWSSNNTAVATVRNGNVTGIAKGDAIVTVKSKSGVTAICMVKVSDGTSESGPTRLNVAKVASLEQRTNFIMGMDASAVPSLEAAGVKYKDFNGDEQDVYKTLKDNGITDIRIRVWNDPYQEGHHGDVAYSYGGGNCDIENAVAISSRCRVAGLGVIIDFHYSDFWADPGLQLVPKAWKNKTEDERENLIYEFTKTSLTSIKATGVNITMVQIGNETTRAICGVDYASNPAKYCAYINAGSRAVREVTGQVAAGGAKVAIHLTNPESRDYVGYANTFKSNSVDYDVFGSSYYPFWHGTLANLAKKLKDVHDVSGKEVMVLETSYAFTNDDFDGAGNTPLPTTTEPFTVQGQSNAILNVIKCIADLGDYGLGVCYWEGTWTAATTSRNKTDNLAVCSQYGCGWASAKAGPVSIGGDGYQPSNVTAAGGVVIDNQAFFRPDGTPLESLKVFKLAPTGQKVNPVADYLYNKQLFYTVNVGTIELPSKVDIVLNDGSKMNVNAMWDVEASALANYIKTVNNYVIDGTTKFGGHVTCTVFVQNPNILTDGSFEDSDGYKKGTEKKIDVPSPWRQQVLSTKQVLQLYVVIDPDDSSMGNKSLHFWDSAAVKFKVWQEIDIAAVVQQYGYGTYGFSLDIMGGDGGDNQDIYAYAVITYKDGSQETTIKGNNTSLTLWQEWHRTAIDEITIDDNVQSLSVGLYLDAAAGAWGNIDNMQFFFKSAPAGSN